MSQDLIAAVRAIWRGAGQTPPDGDEMARACDALERAAAIGRDIPRTDDKTQEPMTGPRSDITG